MAIVKPTLLFVIGGLSLYLLAPKVISVLASWPQLKILKPGWFALHATSWLAMAPAKTPAAGDAIGALDAGRVDGMAGRELLAAGP